jgi:hypothetical protein
MLVIKKKCWDVFVVRRKDSPRPNGLRTDEIAVLRPVAAGDGRTLSTLHCGEKK